MPDFTNTPYLDPGHALTIVNGKYTVVLGTYPNLDKYAGIYTYVDDDKIIQEITFENLGINVEVTDIFSVVGTTVTLRLGALSTDTTKNTKLTSTGYTLALKTYDANDDTSVPQSVENAAVPEEWKNVDQEQNKWSYTPAYTGEYFTLVDGSKEVSSTAADEHKTFTFTGLAENIPENMIGQFITVAKGDNDSYTVTINSKEALPHEPSPGTTITVSATSSTNDEPFDNFSIILNPEAEIEQPGSIAQGWSAVADGKSSYYTAGATGAGYTVDGRTLTYKVADEPAVTVENVPDGATVSNETITVSGTTVTVKSATLVGAQITAPPGYEIGVDSDLQSKKVCSQQESGMISTL